MSTPRPATQVAVTISIARPPQRVWRALCEPAEVVRWDGVTQLWVPEGYPAAGQYARWSSAIGPWRLTLHDRVQAVEPPRRLRSTIDIGFVHVEEEYRLTPSDAGTLLVSDNAVSSRRRGLRWLAVALTRQNIRASLGRLKAFCEGGA